MDIVLLNAFLHGIVVSWYNIYYELLGGTSMKFYNFINNLNHIGKYIKFEKFNRDFY